MLLKYIRKKMVKIELNKIYNIDCIEYMKTLPNNCIDLIIADPPYFKIVKEEWDNQWKTEEDYLNWCSIWISECSRILKEDGTIYVYGSQQLITELEILLKNELIFRKRLIWYRADNQRQRTTIYNENYEPILYFTKTDKYTFNNSALQIPSKYAGQKHKRYDKNGNPYWKEVNPTKQCGDVWEINKVKGGSKEDTKHKTQKPLMICDRIILASSNEEDLIYIPFGGSGSEIVSCIINNRNYIATEINKEYIDEIIIPRIKELK